VKELERLAKRAVKLGCAPPTWVLGSEVVKTRLVPDPEDPPDGKKEVHETYREVEVEGSAPRYEGWRLAAVLQNLGEGNLVKMVPGEDEGLAKAFREVPVKCDHCKLVRRRNETFVVVHDDGRMLQVGRQCIRDFLGHDSPEKLAEAAELMAVLRSLCEDAEETGWGGGGGRRCYEIVEYLTMVACLIRRDGWMSRTAARDIGRSATADDALMAIDPTPDTLRHWEHHPEDRPTPEKGDEDLAAKSVEWATEIGEDANDYLWNVRTVARHGYVDYKSAGIAGSIVQAYQKAVGNEIKKKILEKSDHFGTPKKREVWTLTLVDRWDVEGQYGTTRIHRFLTPEGNVAVWFASRASGMEIGETWKVKATVKKHDVRNGVRQTVLTRCEGMELVKKEEEAAA
jgi:ribosomal protein L36